MRTKITSRICIKPSSPTPPLLKTYKVSLLDQIATNIHANMTFFFPADTNFRDGDDDDDFSSKSLRLQNSISETLTRFYPLAGRLHDAATINCDDTGMYFVEAVADGPLSKFLAEPTVAELDQFLPTTDPETMEIAGGALWIVKFTRFFCGGTAVSISMSHKIVDLSTLITILKSWTATCSGESDLALVVPDFSIATILPPGEIPGLSGSVNLAAEKFIARRFVINAKKIADLKSKVILAGEGGAVSDNHRRRHPSRVELALALIWKSAIAASKAKSGTFRPSVMFHAVNLRSRTDPPLPETAFGNFIWPLTVLIEDEKDVELGAMVTKMRDSMTEFIEYKANKFRSSEEAFATIMASLKEKGEIFKTRPELKAYKCTSWCKFPLFDVDFGWGKPAWVTSANKLVSNTVALLDTSSSGIEILLTLDEEEMTILEGDEELLQFADLNPAIQICT